MRATRTEVAKKLERHHKAPPEEIELAMFTNREALLKRGRGAGLPPREYELFALVMDDPGRFLRNGKLNHREAAQEMDVAVGTIKSLWSRIKKTLAA
jgi:DNA-binding response OmpR family regulator